jgi:hypothetical protein
MRSDPPLNATALRFIGSAVRTGHRTLETGPGRSTIVFAARAASHTCVAPGGEQVERIRRYRRSKGIPPAHVRFIVDRSEEALPRPECAPLDLMLLDGSHSFPQLFIDWYYVATRSRRALSAKARIALATTRVGDLAKVGRMVRRMAQGR